MNNAKLISSLLAQTHYDISWHNILEISLANMDADYLRSLLNSNAWLPGINKIFNAFTLPLSNLQYILLGESPYPRESSANGYAFWDQAVTTLWSDAGLSKPVNRATSLRNFIKMLLVAEGLLCPEKTQSTEVAKIDKSGFIQTNQELFEKLLKHGFLLLNASLTLENERRVTASSQQWRPFFDTICTNLQQKNIAPTFILFGNIAKQLVNSANLKNFPIISSEHPYNLSFISNPDVIKLFKPFQLLKKVQEHYESISHRRR